MTSANSTFELPTPGNQSRGLFHRHPSSRGRAVVGVFIWGGLSLAVAALGALASIQAAEFYGVLIKPSWAPPPGVFGPVWSALYLMMAVAAWLVWQEGRRQPVTPALALYVLALVPNALWSWLFFAWHRGDWALWDVAVLWCLLAMTCVAFWRVRPLAGALMLPVWAWVSFAATLNTAVWLANPVLLGA
ncbi:MAG: TspO/MBR family protein [Pseudomonadota bacterium]